MEKLSFNPDNEQARPLLGRTGDGALVYDREDSHLHQESGVNEELLQEALGKIETGGRNFLKEKVDFDRPVGVQTCVKIEPEDETVMVFRKKRSGMTRMVKNREPEPCSSMIVILRKLKSGWTDDEYEMITSYVGEGSPREPWDPGIENDEERAKCQEYWDSHALVYNEDLIDAERAEAFNKMSSEEKKAELAREKTVYAGIFVDPEDLHQKIRPTLEKPIMTPHITTKFKPGTIDELSFDGLGSEAKITAIGYGNDGRNEGLLVKVETENENIQRLVDDLKTPHITLSISKNGLAKDTAFLNFAPLEKPFEIKGQYGAFAQGKVRYREEDFE